jgi:hypothetical protein
MAHERPLPDGCLQTDFLGASHDYLLAALEIESATPERFLRHLLAAISAGGVTHNQRVLLRNVIDACRVEGRHFLSLPAFYAQWHAENSKPSN